MHDYKTYLSNLEDFKNGMDWIKRSSGTPALAYELTQLQSAEHAPDVTAVDNSICKIDDTHFILAYCAYGSGYVYVKTFVVNNDYSVTNIDSLQIAGYDSVAFAKIDTTHYVLAHKKSSKDGDGVVKTLSIDASCDNIAVVATLEYTASKDCAYHSVAVIDSTHFAVGSKAGLHTFSIDANYANIAVIDTLTFDLSWMQSIVKLDSTHLLFACHGVDRDGFIYTISFDANYDNLTIINTLEFNTAQGTNPSLCVIDSTHYILAYTGNGDNGYIATFSIDDSYQITKINEIEHDITYAFNNSLCKIDTTHFALAYTGTDNHGYIKTFGIDESYNITEIDVLEHDTTNSNGNALVLIDNTHLVLSYCGVDNDGFIKTFEIT